MIDNRRPDWAVARWLLVTGGVWENAVKITKLPNTSLTEILMENQAPQTPNCDVGLITT